MLSWCSKGGGEPQAEFEDEACASPRVAEACCYTELGHVRPAGLGDDHLTVPCPFLGVTPSQGREACNSRCLPSLLCPFLELGASGLGDDPVQCVS